MRESRLSAAVCLTAVGLPVVIRAMGALAEGADVRLNVEAEADALCGAREENLNAEGFSFSSSSSSLLSSGLAFVRRFMMS